MEKRRSEVGFDARMGLVCDQYWFGVPDAHHVHHQGSSDAEQIAELDRGIDAAARDALATARAEVSNLLYDESPSFHQLRDNFDHVHAKLTTAQTIERLAREAHDEIGSAKNYIMLRNITPKTVTVDDHTYVTKKNPDGSTTTERVKTGSHQEPEPDLGRVRRGGDRREVARRRGRRELNGAVNAAKTLFPKAELDDVDADLIGFFDFWGHPSFLVWSFDLAEADRVQGKVGDLRDAASSLVAEIRPEHDRLERKVNAGIDMRWDSLLATHHVS